MGALMRRHHRALLVMIVGWIFCGAPTRSFEHAFVVSHFQFWPYTFVPNQNQGSKMTTPPVNMNPPALPYPDRSGWLTAFGIFQILIACAVLGMIGLMFLGLLISSKMPDQHPMPWRVMMQSVGVYAAAFVFFVVMGIGSIKARRWARSLMLAFSWLWLLGGALGVLIYAFMLPRILKHTPGAEIPENVALVMTIFVLIFMFVIFVALPFAMVMFYRAPSVKATCERRDPMTRWTDRFPIPVLVLLVMLVAGAASFFVMSFTMPYVAIFGRFITGWRGAIGSLLLCCWWAYLSWGTFKLRIASWWATIVTMLVVSISTLLTFLRGDAARMYSSMGMSEEQSAQSAALLHNPVLVGLMGFGLLAFVVFVISLRKHFAPAPKTT
jgi:hypothetical protein